MNVMRLTQDEAKLVADVIASGGTDLELEKSAAQFKVRFLHGNACMGRALVYDVMSRLRYLVSSNAELERQLS